MRNGAATAALFEAVGLAAIILRRFEQTGDGHRVQHMAGETFGAQRLFAKMFDLRHRRPLTLTETS